MSASEEAIKRSSTGAELSIAELAALLSEQDEAACREMYAAANELKEFLWGGRVTYVVNLNLNFTNVCVQHCGFCNFRRDEPFARIIDRLRDAGLGSMPGTAAEILVDEVLRRLCSEKVMSDEWCEIVETAHRAGVRTRLYDFVITKAYVSNENIALAC
ncbi:MAG: hypothetical protein ABR577_05880 [Pyrinomonadaceae bacterium]